ncbi:putative glycosyl hydrolase [Candida tropicalis]
MQAAFSKLKLKSRASDIPEADPPSTAGKPPSTRQIYQSRENYGVNFGACFVLEKWIYHDLFSETDGDTEMDAVSSLVKKFGEDEARSKFENHWNNFVNDDDWKWLQEHHVTSIRLPVGYWDIDGGAYTSGCKFEKYKNVYKNAWTIVKEKYIQKALDHNISVLVDVHGLPGGANNSGHSGESGSGGGFWKDEKAQLSAAKMMGWIAKDLKKFDNIAGIQVVNEAEFSDPAKKQSTYYAACITEIRKSDSSVPVIISDGWWADQWVKWVQEKQGPDGNIGVVLDEHVYRCFSDDDKNKTPQQIIDDLNGDLLTNLTDDGKGVEIIVGEYSCVLDGKSWDNDKNANRDALVEKYGQRQGELLAQRTSGYYFWTYKFQSGNGGEWDFRTMTDKGALIPPPIPTKEPSQDQFDESLNNAYSGHVNYWDNQDPNGKYEHDNFKDGFKTAWKDADAFAKFNGSKIGKKKAWKRSRLQESEAFKKGSKYLWEWEQGFDQGLQSFYETTT